MQADCMEMQPTSIGSKHPCVAETINVIDRPITYQDLGRGRNANSPHKNRLIPVLHTPDLHYSARILSSDLWGMPCNQMKTFPFAVSADPLFQGIHHSQPRNVTHIRLPSYGECWSERLPVSHKWKKKQNTCSKSHLNNRPCFLEHEGRMHAPYTIALVCGWAIMVGICVCETSITQGFTVTPLQLGIFVTWRCVEGPNADNRQALQKQK